MCLAGWTEAPDLGAQHSYLAYTWVDMIGPEESQGAMEPGGLLRSAICFHIHATIATSVRHRSSVSDDRQSTSPQS
jgi:hypothetical protein